MLFHLVLIFLLSHVYCDNVFRFGAVLSTTGYTEEMKGARQGYQLFFDELNKRNDGQGLLLHGKAGTTSFPFKFDFIWKDDHSDIEKHRQLVEELLDEKGPYNVHFLGGSHPTYAQIEMDLTNEKNVLNYHCCVGPDQFYEQDYSRVFGIPASNIEYTRMFIRTLALNFRDSVAFIYDKANDFTRTTCEAGIGFAKELGTFQENNNTIIWTFEEATVSDDFFNEFASTMKKSNVEVVVGCVFDARGKMIVDAFYDIQHGLKATFLTAGPTKPEWINSFDQPSRTNDILSAAQWHKEMGYMDGFFGSTTEYTERFQDKFNGAEPTYVAACASAVGETLAISIQDAFQACDISDTRGDIEVLLFDAKAIRCNDFPGATGYERIIMKLEQLDVETFFGRVKFNYYRRNVGLDPVTTQIFQRNAASGKTYQEIEAVMPLGYATELIHFPASNPFKENCTAGQHIGPDEFNRCLDCKQGEASDQPNADHCDSCPIGGYQNKIGQKTCKTCPLGTTTEIRGAVKITDCICRSGYYHPDGITGAECNPCPHGATCKGGKALPIPNTGYWINKTNREHVYECDPHHICLGGEGVECKKGYTGRLCSSCDSDYFSVLQICKPCLKPAALVFSMLLLLLGWYVINVTVSRSVSSLEMILGWAQLANIIGDINLNWTGYVSTMFGAANLLDFDVDFLQPSCLIEWGYLQNFMTQLALPFLMTLMGCSGYVGSSAIYLLQQRGWVKLEGQVLEIVSVFFEVPEDRNQLKNQWDATIAKFLASVDITYVTIAKYCFDVYKCEDIAGVSVLRVSPDVECGTDGHRTLKIVAAFGIAFYVLGYLSFVSWKLCDLRNRRAFADPTNLVRFGFVYEKYELDYWYTPAIILVRKLVFVLVLVYVNNPAFQVGALAVIINASLILHVYTAPYVDTYMDVLFNFLLLALMFEAFGGLMFYSENLPPSNRRILEWIILTALFLLIVVFLVIFAIEMVNKYCTYYLKAEHRKYVRDRLNAIRGLTTRKKKRRSGFKSVVSFAVKAAHSEDREISFELLDTFNPVFVYNCIRRRPELVGDWDRLTKMLHHYMSDQSDTSYLSMNPVAKFWRKLVDRFPELVDFLAVADEETREKFNEFATYLYRDFYLTKKVISLPLMDVLNWRDYAPMAQWLAIAPSDDRRFFVDFLCQMFRTVGDTEAAEILETRLLNGGSDPQLEKRSSLGKSSKRKKQILQHLNSGSNPFYHSAAEQRLQTAATVLVGVTKFKNLRERQAKNQSTPSSVEGNETVKSTLKSELSMDQERKRSTIPLYQQTSFQRKAESESKSIVSSDNPEIDKDV